MPQRGRSVYSAIVPPLTRSENSRCKDPQNNYKLIN